MRIDMERMRNLLRGRQQVSVPQLQKELALSYGHSRLLVAELVPKLTEIVGRCDGGGLDLVKGFIICAQNYV